MSRFARPISLWIAAAALSLLAGCTAFGPRLTAPELDLVSVELVKGDLFEQRLKVRLRVKNPNDVALGVKSVSYAIELLGEELGRGLSGGSFQVPARGEAEFDMLVTANLAGAMLRIVDGARANGRMPNEVEYRVRGQVRLDRGPIRTVPFDQRGALRLR
jgi:LEA14-like dessication related protein